jgi:hypothetical protein
MVNRGGPSKACDECRRRKIRCDQKRPQCSQCLRIKKQCPGYRDLDDVIFRPYQGQVGERTKSPRKIPQEESPKSKERNSMIDIEADSLAYNYPVSRSQSKSPTRTIAQDPFEVIYITPKADFASPSWGHQAKSYFIAQYTLGPKSSEATFSWFDFVPEMYSTTLEGSPFQTALMAISWANLAGQSSLVWMNYEARKTYGKAITRVNEALQNPITAVQDDILAAVLLLGLYDNMVGDDDHILGSHREGVAALLDLRGAKQFDTPMGRNLYRHVRALFRVLELNALFRKDPRINEPSTSIQTQWSVHMSYNNATGQIIILSNKGANLCVRARDALEIQNLDPENHVLQLLQLLQECEDLEAELINWDATLPENLRSCRYEIYSDQQQGIQPKYLLTYSNPSLLGAISLYRTSRIYVNETAYAIIDLIECLQQNAISIETSLELSIKKQTAAKVSRDLIDDICASMPFAFDDIDVEGNIVYDRPKTAIKAFISILGAWIAHSSTFATAEQSWYARHALTRIGNFFGFKMALRIRGGKRLLPLRDKDAIASTGI